MIYFISQQKIIETEDIKLASIEDCLEYFKDKEFIGVDTETKGFDPYTDKVLLLQLGDYLNQFVIDISTISISAFNSLFTDKNKAFIFHNYQFDGRFLFHNNIFIINVFDTFIAECVLYTGYNFNKKTEPYFIGTSLKDVADRYWNVYLDKSIRGDIHRKGLSYDVIQYAAKDVQYLDKIRIAQLKQIEDKGLTKILTLELDVLKVFTKMCYKGIPFNPTKWREVAEITQLNTLQLEEKLSNLVWSLGTKDLPKTNKITRYCNLYKQGNLFFDEKPALCNINWSSNAQKLALLKDLGISIDSVGEKELQQNFDKHEIFPLLIEYAHQSKLSTAFGESFLKFVNPITKRIHPSIWQILSTGRISVSSPNINQIPSKGKLAKAIRSAFEARPGYKIVGGDYSNFEARLAAEFSQDKVWCNIFRENKDLHSELCANTFKIPITNVKLPFPVKPDITYRDVQKTINFGTIYQMGPKKLAQTIKIGIQEAKILLEDFYYSVPELDKFLKKLKVLGTTRGYIKTKYFGRIRWFPAWEKAYNNQDIFELGKIERASCNTPIQGANADIIKLCLIRLQDIIDTNNYDVTIVLAVYDEIRCEVIESFAEEWAKIQKETMIECAKILIKTIPVVVDITISDCWEK